MVASRAVFCATLHQDVTKVCTDEYKDLATGRKGIVLDFLNCSRFLTIH
ncbi:unknown protein [Cronobacter turicensis z3032]|uniref:Uncharacterized protein n=1 Tax=Cronobacter turicensis (strain DSM 18703 / CCUG 55852 / LMG 23827 / z3032) TaxID=693216 RepID=C9XU83_CROTZ|nr:unknown protein [Cronobacter turicensis z3032]